MFVLRLGTPNVAVSQDRHAAAIGHHNFGVHEHPVEELN